MSSCTNCHGSDVRHTSMNCPKNEYARAMTSKDELREKLKLYYTVAKYSKGFDGFVVDEEAWIDQILNLLEGEKERIVLETQLGMIEYYDQPPDNSSCNWKGLLADNRKHVEYQLATLNKEPNKGEDVDG